MGLMLPMTRTVTALVLLAVVAAACTGEGDDPVETGESAAAPDETSSAVQPEPTVLDASGLSVELRPTAIDVPETLQLEAPDQEELFVSRILTHGEGFRILGGVEDDVSLVPVVFDLHSDATTATRQDLAVPAGVVRSSRFDASQDEQHYLGIGVDGDRRQVGMLWRADALDEVTALTDARDVNDAVDVGGEVLVVGTSAGTDGRRVPTVWIVTDASVDRVPLTAAPADMVPTVVYRDEDQLHVWGNLTTESRPALLTAAGSTDPADLRPAPLPEGMDDARTIEGTYADDNIGRYLVGSRPSETLFQVNVWQRSQGRWIDLQDSLPGTGTSSGYALGEVNGFYYVADALDDHSIIWRAAGSMVLEGEGGTIQAETLAWRSSPEAVSLRIVDGVLHLGEDPVEPTGLVSRDDLSAPRVEAVDGDVALVDLPMSAGGTDRTAIVIGGEVGETVEATLHATVAADAGGHYLLGQRTQDDGRGDVAAAFLVRDGAISELELPVEADVTSRLNAGLAMGGETLLVGHTYRADTPKLLALTTDTDGVVREVELPDSAQPLPASRSGCGPAVVTFDPDLTAGVLRANPADEADHTSLATRYPDSSAAIKCVALTDGRLLVAFQERVLVVDDDGVVADTEVPSLRFGGATTGAVVDADGREVAMALVENPEGDGTAVVLIPPDDPGSSVWLPLDIRPGTVVNTINQPDASRLLVNVVEGRRTTVQEVVLRSSSAG